MTTTPLSFGDSVHVQKFLSVLFTNDFLLRSVLKIVRTLHYETNSVIMCFRKQIFFTETFCKTGLHVFMCNYIKRIQLAQIKRTVSLKTWGKYLQNTYELKNS